MDCFNTFTRHFTVSHLVKLISSLIVLSFKHQNPQGGLDALSQGSWGDLVENRDRSSLFREAGAISKLRQDEPMMVRTIFGDETCTDRFSISNRTLYLSSEYNAWDFWCQHRKKREKLLDERGSWMILSTTKMSFKSTRKPFGQGQCTQTSLTTTWKWEDMYSRTWVGYPPSPHHGEQGCRQLSFSGIHHQHMLEHPQLKPWVAPQVTEGVGRGEYDVMRSLPAWPRPASPTESWTSGLAMTVTPGPRPRPHPPP
jgi:hypothetical protein